MMFPTNVRHVVMMVLLGVVVGASFLWLCWPASATSLLTQARKAESSGNLDRALEFASRSIDRDPQLIEGVLYAGVLAGKLGDHRKELSYYRKLPESANGSRVANRLKDAGQLALKCGLASDAEYFYQRALKLLPDDQVIHRRLGTLFLGEARRWESAPHLLALVKGKSFTLEELAFLGNNDEIYEAEKMIGFFQESNPDDVMPLMGRARLKIFQLSMTQAEAIVQQILHVQPDCIEAHVQMGVILVTGSRAEELEKWRRHLPRAAEDHPETWWVMGKQARQNGDTQGAIRCAWETLRRDPNHLSATYQLAQLVSSEGRAEDARVMFERAAKLEILASDNS